MCPYSNLNNICILAYTAKVNLWVLGVALSQEGPKCNHMHPYRRDGNGL